MTDIVQSLRMEANATEELHPDDSEIEVMRDAAKEIERLRSALRDLAGGMVTLSLADKLPGPVKRAWAALPPEMRL